MRGVAVHRQLGWERDGWYSNEFFHACSHAHIGKLACPTASCKRQTVNAEEWAIVKRHPLVGARFFPAWIPKIIQLAEIVALTHHEKWDGSGYPRGLKGEDIPPGGPHCRNLRRVRRLDCRRPYKLAFPLDEKAYAILRQSSGSHFDPAVVHAFFAAESEVLRAHHEYAMQPGTAAAAAGSSRPGSRIPPRRTFSRWTPQTTTGTGSVSDRTNRPFAFSNCRAAVRVRCTEEGIGCDRPITQGGLPC